MNDTWTIGIKRMLVASPQYADPGPKITRTCGAQKVWVSVETHAHRLMMPLPVDYSNVNDECFIFILPGHTLLLSGQKKTVFIPYSNYVELRNAGRCSRCSCTRMTDECSSFTLYNFLAFIHFLCFYLFNRPWLNTHRTLDDRWYSRLFWENQENVTIKFERIEKWWLFNRIIDREWKETAQSDSTELPLKCDKK